MKLLNWVTANRAGGVTEFDDRYEIEHDSGEHSTLFKKAPGIVDAEPSLEKLGDIYTAFDGADLFSSTFKVAALKGSKYVEGVELVESLGQFNNWVKGISPEFPEESIPFMYQAGIGVYAIGKQSGKIYEWDDEQSALSDEFDSVEDILKEWIDAT